MQLSLGVLPEEASLPLGPLPSPPAAKPLVSSLTRNKVLRFADAIEARRDDKQILAFTPEDFIRFGLPYKRVEAPSTSAATVACATASPPCAEYGVPFGQDRLLPIWLATAYTTVRPARGRRHSVQCRCGTSSSPSACPRAAPSTSP